MHTRDEQHSETLQSEAVYHAGKAAEFAKVAGLSRNQAVEIMHDEVSEIYDDAPNGGHLVALSPQQLAGLAAWAGTHPALAAVQLDQDGEELLVAQGDARARIYPDGTTCEES